MAAGSNIIGEVGLKVVPVDPAAQFQAGVDQLIRKLEKQAQFQVKAAGLDQVQEQVNQTGQAFANAAIQAAGLTAAIYGIRQGIEGAIGKLSGLFDQLAQARAGFTSILHSEEAGGKLLDDIREFARVSPFVTQELVNYSQQLLGVGLAAKEIIPLLKSTGDIISSVGGDTANLSRVLFTLTQIKSIGVLKGQDTMQLQNSLIPITKYLSEYLHKSAQEIVKLREAGLITADTVFNALNQQGEKVKGAMDRATRNIQGARAILSDTITQLFQNQPVLNKIFEDVFRSIQKLADKIGEAEFQQAFAQFFDGVDKVYTGLKPLLAELAKIADSGALTGMQIFGSTLGLVGDALKALGPLLPILARFIAAAVAIKAPVLLLQYVSTFRTLATAIIPATRGLAGLGAAQIKGTQIAAVYTSEIVVQTAQLDANTAALTANQRAILGAAYAQQVAAANAAKVRAAPSKGGVGLAIGATVLGQYLSQKESTENKVAGGALQGAGTGFLIAGPPGAAIGAAIGATTAFFGAQDAQLKKRVEEMKLKGKETAEAFIKANGEAFGTAPTANSYKALNEEIDQVNEKLGEQLKLQTVINNLGFDISEGPELQGLREQIATLTATKAATFDPINSALHDLVENLDKGSVAYEAFTTAGRGAGKRVAVDIDEAQVALERYGFTLDDLNSPERRELLTQYIPIFDHLTTAEQDATRAANQMNEALKTAREASKQLFDPIQTGIADQIAKLQLSQSVITASFAAGQNKNDPIKQLEFQQAVSKAAEDAFTRQLARDNTLLKNLKERQALERQSNEGGLSASELADRQAEEISAFNDAAAIRQAAAAKAEETRATLLLQAAQQSASRTRFALSDAQIKQQEKLLGLQDTQQNREIISNVRGAALQKIDQETQALAANYEQRKATADQYGREIPTLEQSAAANNRLADVISGRVAPATAYERKVVADLNGEIIKGTKAIEDSISPWKSYIDQFDRLKSTGDLLGSLFEVNDDNIVALNATAENIGNVFRSLAGQADAIFNNQKKEGASTLDAEAAAAKDLALNLELVQLTLGQTDAEFAKTLANAGLIEPTFSGLSGSIDEVANKLGVPQQQLANILGIIGQIPSDLKIVINADGTQAIAELNRVKAYFDSIVRDGERHGLGSGDEFFANQNLGNIVAANTAFSGINKPAPGKGAADTAAKDAADAAERIKSATDALADKLQAAADSIVDAAKAWVGSIKERTQYEQAVSAGTAIRNTQRQIKDLTELSAGLIELRARGLSEEAIKSLGIDNVADVKQVRKLLRASPGDVTALSAGVAQLTTQSQALAASEEDRRTQKNIAEGILAAAQTLEIDFSKPNAAALASTINITATSDADAIAAALINALSSGAIGR